MQELQLLHAGFSKFASLHPNFPALLFQNNILSYQELEEQSNKLAHFLIKEKKVVSGSIIAIYTDSNFLQIISILAILKSGGAYLPIDASCPPERAQYMMQDSNAVLVITTNDLLESLTNVDNCISQDILSEKIKQYPIISPKACISPTDLAYIIYTSGSTGQPKGVMVEHQSVYNTVKQMDNIFSLSSLDKVLLNTTISFDPSIWMIFWPLSVGSCLVVCETFNDSIYICNQVIKHNIRLLHAGPTLLRMLLSQSHFKQCQSLQLVIGGGEAWRVSDLDQLKNQIENCELCNVYGPTEASIHVTYWLSKENDLKKLLNIPIGKPINGMKTWILDKNLNELPIEEVGELFLSGIGLARGYLNNPEATKQNFIFTQNKNFEGILYRTGDLAKKSSDGNVTFIGRTDDQIKLRGHRIELKEIEKWILQSNLVKNVHLLVNKEESTTTKIVAFLIQKVNKKIDLLTNIKAYLKSVLPSYMIPTEFILLNNFPLTTNHKIDKPALQLIAEQQKLIGKIDVITSSKDEPADVTQVLIQLWLEILQQKNIDIEDDFFDMGGDSLIALALISKINSKFNLSLSVTDLFSNPTIKMLHNLISSSLDMELQQSLIKVSKDSDKFWPLSDNQKWLLRMAKGSLSINNIVLPLKIEYEIVPLQMEKAILNLTIQHPLLRSAINYQENYGYQMELHDVVPPVFIHIDLSRLSEKQKQNELNLHYERLNNQFVDLAVDPLFKVTLFKCSNQLFYIYIYMHHLISDPFSGTLIIQKILKHYKLLISHAKEETNSFSTEVISFSDYVRAESEKKSTKEYLTNLQRWKDLFIDKTYLFNFGTINNQDLSSEFIRLEIPYNIAQTLKCYAKNNHITLFPVLLSLLKITLYEIYQQPIFAIGFNVAKRNDARWENMIGPLSEQSISVINFEKITNFHEIIQTTMQNIYDALNTSVSIESIYQEIYGDNPHEDFFNILFDYEKNDVELNDSTFKIKKLPVKPSNQVRRHLSIRIVDESEKMFFQVRYRKNLFKPKQINVIMKNYFVLAKKYLTNEIPITDSISL